MATPKKVVSNFEKCCRFCLKDLEISKQGKMYITKRRDLSSSSSCTLVKHLQEFVPDFQPEIGKSFLCMECVNKLNKYDRIKCKHLSTQLEYNNEKDSIINMYKSTEGKRVKRVLLTPHRSRSNIKVHKIAVGGSSDVFQRRNNSPLNTNHGLNKENMPINSTILQQSPSKIPVPINSSSPVKTKGARRKLSITQDTTSFLCQVSYNYPSQTKRKILDNNETYLKIARSIIEERPNQLVSAVWHDEGLREKIVELLGTSVNKECTQLCEIRKDSILQQVEAANLHSFEFIKVLNEWKLKAPIFFKVISFAVTVKELENQNIINIAFAGSILLRGRNKKMSAISHIVGLLLDYGGANDETINRLSKLGASVSSKSVYKKKIEIAKLHENQVDEALTEYKKNIVNIDISKKTLHSIKSLDETNDKCKSPAPIVTVHVTNDMSQLPASMDTQATNDMVQSPASIDIVQSEATNDMVQSPASIDIVQSGYLLHESVIVNGSNPIFSNSLIPSFKSTASLTTSVQDLMMICKNTEKFKVICPVKSDVQLNHTGVNNTLASMNTESVIVQTADVERTKLCTEKFLETCQSKLKSMANIEIYGDNCDLRVNKSHQSKDEKAKDYHWFVALGAELRVKAESTLSEKRPQKLISEVKNEVFLPSPNDNHELQQCFAHHIQKVLVKNLKCVNDFKNVIPDWIDHPHMNDYLQNSQYFLIDLYDKNESKSEDMIDILADLHKKCIPVLDRDKHNVMERKVFGGDVLTNERAYQAQIDMINGETDHEKLLGFIHRPEGLHRLMNLLKYIFEMFYSTSSVNEQGTLYQLKCLLDRRDVKLDMTTAYRQCKNFIDDILDSHIIAAACHYFGMNDQNSTPQLNKIPMYITQTSKENQLEWINSVAKNIIEIYVMEGSDKIPNLLEDVQYMQTQMDSLNNLDSSGKYICPHHDCKKSYKQFHWLKRHLKDIHGTIVNINPPQHSTSKDSVYDGKFNMASAFMKVCLLFRDTEDAYKMGDGNRLIRNAKYEMLHFHQGHHIKYRLWMWRVLAYYTSILSEKEAYEYKWNMSFNMGRGLGHLIPNDNLVEINVHLIKDQCRKMGANITFEGCRRWVQCLKYLHELCINYDQAVEKPSKGGKRAMAKRESDIALVTSELIEASVFSFTNGREHQSFANFSSDLLSSVNPIELNDWINKNKVRAQKEM